MQKVLSTLLLLFALSPFATNPAFAQTLISNPQPGLRLDMQLDGGSNGAAVVWHPVQKKYYAAIAGNAEFPLEVFSETGEPLSGDEAGVDIRGMWYNSSTRKVECNGYGESGIYTIVINNQSGEALGAETIMEGSFQPDAQSAGVFNPSKNEILYYNDGTVYSYKRSNGNEGKSFALKGLDTESISPNTLAFTGIKKRELGLLDINSGKLLLYSLKGKKTATVDLPADAPFYGAFNWSYANKQLWLFDKDERSWTGYQIFR